LTNLPQLSQSQKNDLAKFHPEKKRQILKRKLQEKENLQRKTKLDFLGYGQLIIARRSK